MQSWFSEYEFKSEECKTSWSWIEIYSYENMELRYSKYFFMQTLLIYFRKAFKIAPITLKNNTESKYSKYRYLVIYILTKYSQESFDEISKEFYISVERVKQISLDYRYKTNHLDDIKLFFKQFENEYLLARKDTLALQEIEMLNQSRQDNVKKDIL